MTETRRYCPPDPRSLAGPIALFLILLTLLISLSFWICKETIRSPEAPVAILATSLSLLGLSLTVLGFLDLLRGYLQQAPVSTFSRGIVLASIGQAVCWRDPHWIWAAAAIAIAGIAADYYRGRQTDCDPAD